MNERHNPQEVSQNTVEAEREKSLRELAERIMEGKGLEALAERGWVDFRDALKRVSFADLLNRQIPQLEGLIQQGDLPEERPATGEQNRQRWDAARQANMQAYNRVYAPDGLIAKYSSAFSPDKRTDYEVNPYGYYASATRANKLQANGNFIHDMVIRDPKTGEPIFNSIPPVDLYKFLPVIRLYVPVKTSQAPEAYSYLLEKMREAKVEHGFPSEHFDQDKQVINFNDLMLNLANLQSQRTNNEEVYSNNTIILFTNSLGAKYSMGSVAKILLAAQQEHPEIFKLPPRFEAQAKLRMLRDFMIPLGNAGYIEQQDASTYQKRDLFHIVRELFGNEAEGKFWPNEDRNEDSRSLHFMTDNLRQTSESLKQWTPENPGDFARVKRHKYMPALVDTKMRGW